MTVSDPVHNIVQQPTPGTDRSIARLYNVSVSGAAYIFLVLKEAKAMKGAEKYSSVLFVPIGSLNSVNLDDPNGF